VNRCPHCFTGTSAREASFVCVGGCTADLDPRATQVLGVDLSSRPVRDVSAPPDQRRARRPSSTVCLTCDTPTNVEVCRLCHQPFPAGWTELSTTCVAMAGARATGKSIYIAVLVQQLAQLAQQLSSTFTAFDATTATQYREVYEKPLLQLRQILDSTRAARTGVDTIPPPLIYSLGTVGRTSHVLVIRDVAGENLESDGLDPEQFGFFRRADAVLFLVDPLQIRAIRSMLAGVVPEQLLLGRDPMSVLSGLIRLLRHGQPQGRIAVPTGIVLSKFDALQALAEVPDPTWRLIMRNPGAAFQRDPSLSGPAYDRTEVALLQEETRSLLHQLGATQLLTLLDTNFEEAQLFVVSALGNPPSGDHLHASGIAPFRVLDPVKWALARSGLVPTR
jgi:hypothetical protein